MVLLIVSRSHPNMIFSVSQRVSFLRSYLSDTGSCRNTVSFPSNGRNTLSRALKKTCLTALLFHLLPWTSPQKSSTSISHYWSGQRKGLEVDGGTDDAVDDNNDWSVMLLDAERPTGVGSDSDMTSKRCGIEHAFSIAIGSARSTLVRSSIVSVQALKFGGE